MAIYEVLQAVPCSFPASQTPVAFRQVTIASRSTASDSELTRPTRQVASKWNMDEDGTTHGFDKQFTMEWYLVAAAWFRSDIRIAIQVSKWMSRNQMLP